MNYERAKKIFINIKKEQLAYIDLISKYCHLKKKITEIEMLKILRKLNDYDKRVYTANETLRHEALKKYHINKRNGIEDTSSFDFEITLDKDFLKNKKNWYKEFLLDCLKIDKKTMKINLEYLDIIWEKAANPVAFNILNILCDNYLFDKKVYIFSNYRDYAEDCYGPLFADPEDLKYAVYKSFSLSRYSNDEEEVPKKEMDSFEEREIILKGKHAYLSVDFISSIFREELLNKKNITIEDCVKSTQTRLDKISLHCKNADKLEKLHHRLEQEKKEKELLEKIKNIYNKASGELIEDKTLYTGKFLKIISECYKIQDRIIEKEKVIKNNGKNAVIVVSITSDNQYIITLQNRMNEKMIAEFPSGYIEPNETPIDAAKRELMEETGYSSDNVFIIDEVYTSPGIDNSKTCIAIASNCIKTGEDQKIGNEIVSYGTFNKKELDYMIENGIMSGAINKLAYYNLMNNVTFSKKSKTYMMKNKQKLEL